MMVKFLVPVLGFVLLSCTDIKDNSSKSLEVGKSIINRECITCHQYGITDSMYPISLSELSTFSSDSLKASLNVINKDSIHLELLNNKTPEEIKSIILYIKKIHD